MKKVDEVDSKSRKFAADVDTVKKSIEDHKAAVKSIVIGQDEKLNWILFNSFVNRALPKPDGTNLNKMLTKPDNKSAKELYWAYNGQMAYQKFLAQQMGTAKALDKVDEDDWRCPFAGPRSEEHTSELQSHLNLVCRLLLEKKKNK